jgi:hypothetical protein
MFRLMFDAGSFPVRFSIGINRSRKRHADHEMVIRTMAGDRMRNLLYFPTLFSERLYVERLVVDSDSTTRLCNRHRLPVLRDLFVIDNFLAVSFVGSFDRIWIDQFVEKIAHIAA